LLKNRRRIEAKILAQCTNVFISKTHPDKISSDTAFWIQSGNILFGARLLAPTWAKKPMLMGLFFICSGIKKPPFTVNVRTLYHEKRHQSIEKHLSKTILMITWQQLCDIISKRGGVYDQNFDCGRRKTH
jgi:hypothetical protein